MEKELTSARIRLECAQLLAEFGSINTVRGLASDVLLLAQAIEQGEMPETEDVDV